MYACLFLVVLKFDANVIFCKDKKNAANTSIANEVEASCRGLLV
jgi:hypothetical protein